MTQCQTAHDIFKVVYICFAEIDFFVHCDRHTFQNTTALKLKILWAKYKTHLSALISAFCLTEVAILYVLIIVARKLICVKQNQSLTQFPLYTISSQHKLRIHRK